MSAPLAIGFLERLLLRARSQPAGPSSTWWKASGPALRQTPKSRMPLPGYHSATTTAALFAGHEHPCPPCPWGFGLDPRPGPLSAAPDRSAPADFRDHGRRTAV